ncbi:MAG: hypothetical protein GX591_11060 [Planctomycetes bacterium]|nr:hypothetical protein [Planctomycetota bacterium]
MRSRWWIAPRGSRTHGWQEDEILKQVPAEHHGRLVWRAWRDRRFWPVCVVSVFGFYAAIFAMQPVGNVLFHRRINWLFVIGMPVTLFCLQGFLIRRLRSIIRRDLEHLPCFHCGYSTIGLDAPRCPECGTTFDPAVYDAIETALEREKAGQTTAE